MDNIAVWLAVPFAAAFLVKVAWLSFSSKRPQDESQEEEIRRNMTGF